MTEVIVSVHEVTLMTFDEVFADIDFAWSSERFMDENPDDEFGATSCIDCGFHSSGDYGVFHDSNCPIMVDARGY